MKHRRKQHLANALACIILFAVGCEPVESLYRLRLTACQVGYHMFLSRVANVLPPLRGRVRTTHFVCSQCSIYSMFGSIIAFAVRVCLHILVTFSARRSIP